MTANGSATTTTTAYTVTTNWKPVGRGRRFDRMRRGLSRRLRIPFVRQTKWDQQHPESFGGREPIYGNPWTSDNCLANFSFACTCHKGDRYDRRRGR